MNIEHQIIGCLFDKPELAKTMQVRLDHFDGFCEREMFKNLVDLIGEGLTPDAVLLAERIEQRSGQNMLPEIADLLGGAWSLGNVPRLAHQAVSSQSAGQGCR